MVSRLNTRNIVVFLMLYLSNSIILAASSRLEVEIKNETVEYGKSFIVTITAKELNLSLKDINLDSINQKFFIDNKRYELEANYQKMILKLFPRNLGELEFPALTLGEASSKTQYIKAIEGKVKGENIQVHLSQSTQSPWQRQQIIITLKVITKDQFASLKNQSPTLPGFKIISLKSDRQWITEQGEQKTHLQTGWVLYPLLPGVQNIELPAVTYHIGGVKKRSYHLPLVNLNVKKLPPYIPPTMPVGKITLQSKLETDVLLRNNSLAFWKISLRSTEVIPQWFPAIVRQIKTNTAVEFFPVDSKRNLQRYVKGIESEVEHRIPFKIKSSGWRGMPSVRFQYFDTEVGRLQNVTSPTVSQFSLAGHWMVLAVLMIIISMIYIAYKAVIRIQKVMCKREDLRKILSNVDNVSTFSQLRLLLRKYAEIQQWPHNVSLSGWYYNWCEHFKTTEELQKIIDQISIASYAAQNTVDIALLKTQLFECLKQPQRIRRIFF